MSKIAGFPPPQKTNKNMSNEITMAPAFGFAIIWYQLLVLVGERVI